MLNKMERWMEKRGKEWWVLGDCRYFSPGDAGHRTWGTESGIMDPF